MKIFILISILLILAVSASYAQTVIPATLSVDSFSRRPDGLYRFYRNTIPKDSVDMGKTTQIPCKQRTVIGFSINNIGLVIATYDDGSTSSFTFKNTIFIQ
jgi:hypothetical protein